MSWARSPERGATWLVALMLGLMRHMGWFARRIVLPGISAWFFATSPRARAASREFLGAALGRPARARDVLAHFHSFALAILDRATAVTTGPGAIRLEVSGLAHVEAAVAAGRGGVLLGGHLGSFAVLRGLAQRCPVPVHALMWQGNDGPYTRAMLARDPEAAASIIRIGDVDSMLRVREAVAAGGLVGILADRAPEGARCVTTPFFGRPATFPIGPFALAASLGVPVITFHGVRAGPGRYAVTFAPFAERITLHRATRAAELAGIIARYAAWLETACRAHPFSWFNFFAFWERAEHAPSEARPKPAAAPRPDVRPGAPLLGTAGARPGPAAR